jgi:hypothetical protein
MRDLAPSLPVGSDYHPRRHGALRNRPGEEAQKKTGGTPRQGIDIALVLDVQRGDAAQRETRLPSPNESSRTLSPGAGRTTWACGVS